MNVDSCLPNRQKAINENAKKPYFSTCFGIFKNGKIDFTIMLQKNYAT